MAGSRDLRQRRSRLARAWTGWVEGPRRRGAAEDDGPEDRGAEGVGAPVGRGSERVRPEILASWERSADAIPPDVTEAPLADAEETLRTWESSPLRHAVERLEPELRRAAEDGDLVVAVTDPQARILWTYGGRVMRRRAEAVNFVAGGRWDEASVGTNALDLALRVDGPATVYSAEHFAPIVHGWVCWAAPVHDPLTGDQLGVLDLSTTWERTHPIGTAAAQALARLLERELGPPGVRPPEPERPHGTALDLRLLGAAETLLDGVRLLLTRRQTEILALLALHPEGLSLDQLQTMVYGGARTSSSTLKVEVSHLRSALGGRLSSRPYRLELPVSCDVTDVLERVRAGDVLGAVSRYGGDLLPGSASPELAAFADVVAVALREALLADPQPEAVLRYSERVPPDVEVLERSLRALGDAPSPARALLRGRLHAASA